MTLTALPVITAGCSFEEAGRYLETYKSFESKPPDLIMEKSEGTYMSRVYVVIAPVLAVKEQVALCGTVCVMARCASVCPIYRLDHCSSMWQVCGQAISTSHHMATAHRCGGFAAVGPVGRRYWSTVATVRCPVTWHMAARHSAANVSRVTLSADVGSWTQTCRKCRKLGTASVETDWFSMYKL